MADILVVDDDQSVASAFEYFLADEGHQARFASSAADAAALIEARRPDLVFMDVRMPGVDGLQALESFRARFRDLSIVIMTAYGTSQTSIDAIRAGAFDYLTKPLDLAELRSVISNALAAQRGREAAGAADEDRPAPRVSLVGESAAMLEVYKMIGRLATNDVPALIAGEHGTGKRIVAATIHKNSARREQPFVSTDCAAVSDDVIDAYLFGGGAGTVELAGIESLSKAAQARLASALRDDRTHAASGPQLTARVLASTSRDLAADAREGRFSWELYEVLSVILLRLPPLRDRRDDVPLLARHFVQRFNEALNRAIKGVDERASKLLREHAWPGNVGELELVLKRACVVAKGDIITADDIGGSLVEGRFTGRHDAEGALGRSVRAALQERLVARDREGDDSPFHQIVDLVESALVMEALTITNGNQVKAAELLGVNRATLRKRARAED
jgi:DNA-binding NtrC family response regulator